MGNSSSARIDRFYGNYEKSFERIEKDVQRLKGKVASRAQTKSSLSMWSAALVVMTIAVAVGIIYQVQQQPHGSLTYQQHFNRVGGAMALPACAVLLHWLLALVLEVQQRRDAKKLQRLETAKRNMLKELKEMSRFDRIKGLIDKFDPDVRPPPAVLQPSPGHMIGANGHIANGQGQLMQRMMQQPGQQAQMPALLVKGSGQVAGAAALAVAGAGKALFPLVDKLANTLISDNPMLLEDLRRAQHQLQEAEVRTMGAMQENLSIKFENLDLKQRLVALEKQLNVAPSFDAEALVEQQQQLEQQGQQAQQAAWQMGIQQQYLQVPPGQEGASPCVGHSGSDGDLAGSNNSSSSSSGDVQGSRGVGAAKQQGEAPETPVAQSAR